MVKQLTRISCWEVSVRTANVINAWAWIGGWGMPQNFWKCAGVRRFNENHARLYVSPCILIPLRFKQWFDFKHWINWQRKTVNVPKLIPTAPSTGEAWEEKKERERVCFWSNSSLSFNTNKMTCLRSDCSPIFPHQEWVGAVSRWRGMRWVNGIKECLANCIPISLILRIFIRPI